VKTPIVKAYGVFRAVDVPSGKNSIVFSYQPLSFTLGKIFTFFGGMGILTLALLKSPV
jgi:uncharacterized membrane protein YfhO